MLRASETHASHTVSRVCAAWQKHASAPPSLHSGCVCMLPAHFGADSSTSRWHLQNWRGVLQEPISCLRIACSVHCGSERGESTLSRCEMHTKRAREACTTDVCGACC
eukprot:3406368-Pleurochrysis_carterae.AAC.1